MKHHELPMLAGIAGLLRWIEELVNLISGPLLTVGLGIALVDLLTDGHLLTALPLLLYTWAITQAVGVDAQLVAAWDRARIALRERRYWALVGLVMLGGVLAYVAWVAAQVFALQESEGLTTAAALSRLGMDSSVWLVQRTALSVFLVCLAGWTRYHPPAPDVGADTQVERARLEASLELEPLRQRLRAQQAHGVRSVVAAAIGKDAPDKPPTGPGSPVRTRRQGQQQTVAPVIQLPRAGTRRHVAARKRAQGALRNPQKRRTVGESVETKARAHFTLGMSVKALGEAAGISRASAQKYHAMLTAEQQSQAAR
jgi:hypothetical protein